MNFFWGAVSLQVFRPLGTLNMCIIFKPTIEARRKLAVSGRAFIKKTLYLRVAGTLSLFVAQKSINEHSGSESDCSDVGDPAGFAKIAKAPAG